MGIDLSGDVFRQIKEHAGHKLESVIYGDGANAAIECVTCGSVLIDADPKSVMGSRSLPADVSYEEQLGHLLVTVDEAYNCGEMRLSESLPNGERGDGLADFIATEIREVCQGEPPTELYEVALGAMDRARRELDGVCEAIETAETSAQQASP